MNVGIVVVAHTKEMAVGLAKTLQHIASQLSITAAGGDSKNNVGTSMARIETAFKANLATELMVFYDFGSARRNIELAAAFGEKNVYIYDAAFTEGACRAATMLQAGKPQQEINQALQKLMIKAQQ